MTTLYDVIGAGADDDAEAVKNAFRKAVKATHPDLHVADPHSAERFRQVVCANAILSDPDQRAVYDHFLAFERWQEHCMFKRGLVVDTLRNLAVDAFAVVLLAAFLAAGYLIFMQVAKSSSSDVAVTEMALSEAETPSRGPQGPEEQVGRGTRVSSVELHELLFGSESSHTVTGGPTEGDAKTPLTVTNRPAVVPTPSEADGTNGAMAAPAPAAEDAVAQGVPELAPVGKEAPRPAGKVADGGAARSDHTDPEVGDAKTGNTMVGEAPSNESSSAGAKVGDIKIGEAQAGDRDTSDGQSKDPQFYFERGVAFYRNGDLDQALVNFNRAILLDPTFASAYVNRSIVFYRKADVARAFADVARAARIKGSRKLASRSDRAAGAAPRY